MQNRIILLFLLLVISSGVLYPVDINTLDDDEILVEIDDFFITLGDFKAYVSGWSRIDKIDAKMFKTFLDMMVIDILFRKASTDEGIVIRDEEVLAYADHFFKKRQIDFSIPVQVEQFFSNSDTYTDMEDFFVKSLFYLYKIKYLAVHDALSEVETYHVFFTTQGLSGNKLNMVRSKARRVTNQISSGNTLFEEAVFKYNEDYSSEEDGLIGNITPEGKSKWFSRNDVLKIMHQGIFIPLYLETDDGIHIIINKEAIPDEGKVMSIIDELTNKYNIVRKITIQ